MSVLQSIIDAVAQGAVFALVAVGIALVFGVLRLVNFAYGELITIGAYVLALTSDWPIPLSLLACLAASVALSVLTERVAFRPLRDAAPATTLVATFAVAFALEAVWRIAFGVDGRSADVLGGLNKTAISGALDVRWITIVELVAGIALLAGLALLLNRTSVGLHMRAAAADIRTARSLGVRADRVITFAFVLAGVLAGVVAMLLTAAAPLVQPTFGLEVTIFALVGVVVGGMDNLVSATLGGFVMGVANSLLGDILPADLRVFLPSFTFLLVIIVLVLRPAGLFRARAAAEMERV
jgi:branched-chain amino acid transport system permease protein